MRAVVANGPGQPPAVERFTGHAALGPGPLIRDIPTQDDFTEAGAPFAGTGRRTHIAPAGVTQP